MIFSDNPRLKGNMLVILWGLSRKKLVKMELIFFNVSENDILWREQLDRLAVSDSRYVRFDFHVIQNDVLIP